MGIDSCDHNDFIVVYDVQKSMSCPVCDMGITMADLENEVESLKENQNE